MSSMKKFKVFESELGDVAWLSVVQKRTHKQPYIYIDCCIGDDETHRFPIPYSTYLLKFTEHYNNSAMYGEPNVEQTEHQLLNAQEKMVKDLISCLQYMLNTMRESTFEYAFWMNCKFDKKADNSYSDLIRSTACDVIVDTGFKCRDFSAGVQHWKAS